MKRICCLMFLGFLFVVIVLSAAAEPETFTVEESIVFTQEDDGFPSNDAMAEQYLQRAFYGEKPRLRGVTARSGLTGAELTCYDALKPLISEIADGTQTSSILTIPFESIYEKTTFTFAELELATGASEDQIKTALGKKLSFGDGMIRALLYDCPYDLYWYDKTTGCQIGTKYGYTRSVVPDHPEQSTVSITNGTAVFRFSVSREFAASAAFTVNSAFASDAANAKTNAASCVLAHEKDNDIAKLTAYKTLICELASYDTDTAAGGSSVSYGNPWQLLYVFDGDKYTTVVCEGYAKAFQYLCDLSSFSTNTVKAICVSGTMSGGTGAGRHMWNIVTLANGNHYLVDVTNCDAGSIGAPDKLFLAYNPTGSADTDYTFTIGTSSITYTYDTSMRSLYSTEELTIAAQAPTHVHDNITFTAWTSADSLPSTAGNYFLTQAVTLSGTWDVPEGITNLCLSGYSIAYNGTAGSVIHVPDTATLNLYDCTGVPGTITGGKGKEIQDSDSRGGGVYVSGTFTMHGGIIAGNSANNGGGVYVAGGTFCMSGGRISSNSAVNAGGGVCFGDGILTMTGGSITGNTVGSAGGGVYFANGTLKLSGNPAVTGNTVSNVGNNIFLTEGRTLTVNGALTNPGTEPQIGITMAVPGTFTSGYPGDGSAYTNSAAPSAYFASDNSSMTVVPDDSQEAKLYTYVPVTGVTLNRQEMTFTYGDTTAQTLTATVSPENASDRTVVWSSGNESVATVKDGTVTAVNAGTTTITATSADGNETATCTVTVNKAEITPEISIKGWTYGDEPGTANLPVVTGNAGNGEVTWTYAGTATDGTAYSGKDLPVRAGEYTATASIQETANYYGKTETATFTVARRPVTVSGISAKGKTYDGTTAATLDFTNPVISGKLPNDDLSVTATGAFDTAGAGTGKTVTISNLTLTGNDRGNYLLAESGQQTTAAADITKSQTSITSLPAAGAITYGQALEASGLAGGTASVPGTFAWTSSATVPAVSDSGRTRYEVTFTPIDTGNYLPSACEVQVTVSPKALTGATVTLEATQFTYNGLPQSIRVTGVTIDGMSLAAADYEVTGQITETDRGSYTVTVTGKGNYTGSATAAWQIVEKAMTVHAENVNVTYDGKAHGLSVSVADPANGAVIRYGTTDGVYDLETPPAMTDAGTMAVYYKVTAANYTDYSGSATVTVAKAKATVTAEAKTKKSGEEDPALTATVSGTVGKDQLNYTLARQVGESAGAYAITVILGSNPNYDVTTVGNTFTITLPEEPGSMDDPESPEGQEEPENSEGTEESETPENPEKPDESADSENPKKPDESAYSEKPEEPENPEEPEKPDKSEESQEPDVPIDPGEQDIPGDVNEDGVVDGLDVIRLMKYLAEETDPETGRIYEINEHNADVTGDGEVDGKDLIRLVRYLGGEPVTLEQEKR